VTWAVGFVVVAENHEWPTFFDGFAVLLEHQPRAITGNAIAQLVYRENDVVIIRRTDERVVLATLAGVGHDHFGRWRGRCADRFSRARTQPVADARSARRKRLLLHRRPDRQILTTRTMAPACRNCSRDPGPPFAPLKYLDFSEKR